MSSFARRLQRRGKSPRNLREKRDARKGYSAREIGDRAIQRLIDDPRSWKIHL